MPVHAHSRGEVMCEHWWIDRDLRVHYSGPKPRRGSKHLRAKAAPVEFAASASLSTPPVVTNTGPLFRCEDDAHTYRLLRPHPALVQKLWEIGASVDSADPLTNAPELMEAWDKVCAEKAHLGAGAMMKALAPDVKSVDPPPPPAAGASGDADHHVKFGKVRVREHVRIAATSDESDADEVHDDRRDGAAKPKPATSRHQTHRHEPKLMLGWEVAGETELDLNVMERDRAGIRVPRGHLHSLPVGERLKLASSGSEVFALGMQDGGGAEEGPASVRHAPAGSPQKPVVGILKHTEEGAAAAKSAMAASSRRRAHSTNLSAVAADGEQRELEGWWLGTDSCLRVQNGHTSRVLSSSGRIVLTESGHSYRVGRVDPRVLRVLDQVGVLFDPENPLVNIEALKHVDRVLTCEQIAQSVAGKLDEMHHILSHGPARDWVDSAFDNIATTMQTQLAGLGINAERELEKLKLRA